MTERIVRTVWWTLVLGFIAAAAIGAIYLGYWGLGELLAGRWEVGSTSLVISLTLAGGVWLACRHRTDLLYG